jgi:hypothetical protein
MPPPPPPARVQLSQNTFGNNTVLAMPSLYSPSAPPATPQYYNYYTYTAAPSSFFAPAQAAAAGMMKPPSSSWPYFHLNPRYSGHGHVMVSTTAPAAVNGVACVGHLPPPPPPSLCLFPALAHAQASAQGVAAPVYSSFPTTAAGAFRPIAMRPIVSPEDNRSNHSRRVTAATAAATAAFLESKPSAYDAAPPAVLPKEEEAPPPAAAQEMRNAVTPDAEANDETTPTTLPGKGNDILPDLFDEEDIPYVSPTHYIIGSEILEAYVVPKYEDDDKICSPVSTKKDKKTKKKKNSKTAKKKANFRAGSIAFRCRFCKHSPHKNKAPLSTIYPESLKGLYRANLRFQANHLSSCQHFPDELKERLGNVRRRVRPGAREYWIQCAARKGFCNVEDKKKMLGFAAQEYY